MKARYQVVNSQSGKLIFGTDDYELACRVAFIRQDHLESKGLDSTYIGVRDTHSDTPKRFISQVI